MASEKILKSAREMFLEDYKSELATNGVLKPSKNANPLWPPWSGTEYEAMERDTAKYFLYYSAISSAMLDIANNRKDHPESKPLVCLVLGAGRGRLIDYCLDCLSQNKLKGIVHVIDANVGALKLISEKHESDKRVIVHPAVIIRDYNETIQHIKEIEMRNDQTKALVQAKNVDLMVSELFGSFADNEFMPEILSVAMKLFASDSCVQIPQSYTTYAVPVHSKTIEDFFSDTANEQRNSENLYILGLPEDTVFLSEVQKVYQKHCNVPAETIQGEIKAMFHSFDAKKAKTEEACSDVGMSATPSGDSTAAERQTLPVTGLAGYFTTTLYGDICIDTRPGPTRNTFFWETAFFPLDITTKDELMKLVGPKVETFEDKDAEDGKSATRKRRKSANFPVTFNISRHVRKHPNASKDAETAKFGEPRPPDTKYSLWYEWFATDGTVVVGNVHNSEGRHHKLQL